MELFYAFSISFIVSFLGSIQPGPVNLAVLSASVQYKYKNALLIAIGGSWPEFVFCFLAIKATSLIVKWQPYFFYFQIALILLFLLVGIYLWLSKKAITANFTDNNGVKLGSILAILNPQLILFWTAIITYFQINKLFNIELLANKSIIFIFCLGACLGAFSLHLFIILLTKKFVKLSFQSFLKYADKFTAIIFIILALVQFMKITF
jgi:threonine/homoserine/homoserine lactone efflux protein